METFDKIEFERDDTDWTERVLVVYAHGDEGRSRAISEVLAEDLRRDGLIAEVSDARLAPPPEDYDAVVIGSGIRFGRPARPAIRYIQENRTALSAMPAFWFSVSEAGHLTSASDSDVWVRQLSRKTHWHPTESATFGAPDPEAMLRRIVATLTRRREDVTQWHDVHEFAHRIAEKIPAAQLQQLAP